MTDLLTVLDRALDELLPGDNSRRSRSPMHIQSTTETVKSLATQVVPVVPVVPAQAQGMSAGIFQSTEPMLAAEHDGEEVARASIPSEARELREQRELAVSRQAFPRADSSRNIISDGNAGNPKPAATPFESEFQERYQERAGIAEFDGRIPRAWAEGFARLQTMPCPAGTRPEGWQHVIDDTGLILDRWAARAAAPGWDTAGEFDHLEEPVERERASLVWLLHGREVMAFAADTVRIGKGSAPSKSYRCRPRRGDVPP